MVHRNVFYFFKKTTDNFLEKYASNGHSKLRNKNSSRSLICKKVKVAAVVKRPFKLDKKGCLFMRNHTKSGTAELKLLHLLPRTKIIQNNLSDPKAWQRCAKGNPQSKRAFPALPAPRPRCGVEYNCLALWNFLRNTGGRGHMGWEKPHPRDSRSSLWLSSPGPGMAKLGGRALAPSLPEPFLVFRPLLPPVSSGRCSLASLESAAHGSARSLQGRHATR